MCELFAASMLLPSRVTMSFATFCARGGHTGKHRDGWGIAFYDGRDCTVLREPGPAADSVLAHAMLAHGVRSHLIVSHIRLATQGPRALHNTHPFARELGGVVHTFAHNGDLPGCRTHPELRLGFARPIGETDSEFVFCCLLSDLAPLWRGPEPPTLAQRTAVVRRFAARLRPLGPANFLYTDGEALFAHGHRRTQSSGRVEPPGLWTLARQCGVDPEALHVPGLAIDAREHQHVVLVASVPLTPEAWRPLGEGELLVTRDGVAVPDDRDHDAPLPRQAPAR